MRRVFFYDEKTARGNFLMLLRLCYFTMNDVGMKSNFATSCV